MHSRDNGSSLLPLPVPAGVCCSIFFIVGHYHLLPTLLLIYVSFIIVSRDIPSKAVPWLRLLVAALSLRAPGSRPVSPYGIFDGQNDTGTVFSPSSSVFTRQYISPPLLHTHLLPPHEVCDSPDQAAQYHTLGPKLGASSLTGHLAGTEEIIIILYPI
jgi:hypothetical protein